MAVHFDHTLVASRDKHASACFFAELFGLPEPEEKRNRVFTGKARFLSDSANAF